MAGDGCVFESCRIRVFSRFIRSWEIDSFFLRQHEGLCFVCYCNRCLFSVFQDYVSHTFKKSALPWEVCNFECLYFALYTRYLIIDLNPHARNHVLSRLLEAELFEEEKKMETDGMWQNPNELPLLIFRISSELGFKWGEERAEGRDERS